MFVLIDIKHIALHNDVWNGSTYQFARDVCTRGYEHIALHNGVWNEYMYLSDSYE